jgi:glutamate formiminotransferase / 5-formyltetrahydrofolate cyclo-ligase
VCAANVSEGRDPRTLDALRKAASALLLDVHVDADHNRTVLTMAGDHDAIIDTVVQVAAVARDCVDLAAHEGVHPRFGAIDVVPFVPLRGADLTDAVTAREAVMVGLSHLGIPCFRYGPCEDGPERSLPELRHRVFRDLYPDVGPREAHPSAGATAVGARLPMVAWNIWLHGATLAATRSIAAAVRSEHVRALGFQVSGATQVSCNLVDPSRVTPLEVYAKVESLLPEGVHMVRCELVGLAPRRVLDVMPESWWSTLDLSPERTVEGAAAHAGLDVDGAD